MKYVELPEAWSEWQLVSLIGKGAYSKVYRAINKEGDVSAIKIISFRGQEKVVEEDGYEVVFKAGVTVEVEICEEKAGSISLWRRWYGCPLFCVSGAITPLLDVAILARLW